MKNLDGAIATLTGGWIGQWQVKRHEATVMVAIADTHLDGPYGYDPDGASYTMCSNFNMSRFDANEIIYFIIPYVRGFEDD